MKDEKLKQIESLIKIKVDAIIREELSDPRLRLMSIVHVKVSKELDSASIFISHPGDETIRKEVHKILKTASGFLEAKLRNSIRLRRIPRLDFRLDDSMIAAARIEELLKSIKTEDTEEPEPEENDEEE